MKTWTKSQKFFLRDQLLYIVLARTRTLNHSESRRKRKKYTKNTLQSTIILYFCTNSIPPGDVSVHLKNPSMQKLINPEFEILWDWFDLQWWEMKNLLKKFKKQRGLWSHAQYLTALSSNLYIHIFIYRYGRICNDYSYICIVCIRSNGTSGEAISVHMKTILSWEGNQKRAHWLLWSLPSCNTTHFCPNSSGK